MHEPSPRRLPRLVRRFGSLALGLLVAAACLEFAARALLPAPEFTFPMPFDPQFGFRMRRNVEFSSRDEQGLFPYRLNSEGFRSRELPEPDEPKPPGTSRLLFLGDSFLNASAVRDEQRLSTVSAALATQRLERIVEAHVLCCDDYGTGQQWLLLREFGERVRPDAIVLCLFPSNDLPNNEPRLAGRTEVSAGDYVRPYMLPGADGGVEVSYIEPWKARLRRHSRVAALLDRYWVQRERAAGRTVLPAETLSPQERLRAGRTSHEYLEAYREPQPGSAWDAAWTRTLALVDAVHADAQRRGARFLLLVLPHRFQVQLDAFSAAVAIECAEAGGADVLASIDLSYPERRIVRHARARGIETRLLLEPLREAVAREGRGYYVRDLHFNGAANELAGRCVADWYCEAPTAPNSGLDATFSAPVSLLPTAQGGQRTISFHGGMVDSCAGYGVWDWRSDWFGIGPGCATEGVGNFVVPAPVAGGSGRIVMRGFLPSRARFPVELRMRASFVGTAALVVEGPGPFELALPAPAAFPAVPLLAQFRALHTFSVADQDPTAVGAIVTEVGYTEAVER